MTNATIPPDMLVLLGRLDGKLDGIVGTLAVMTSRQDNHEQRLHLLETDAAGRKAHDRRLDAVESKIDTIEQARDKEAGRHSGWLDASRTAKAVIVGLVGIAGYLGYKLEIQPDAVLRTKTVIEQSHRPG